MAVRGQNLFDAPLIKVIYVSSLVKYDEEYMEGITSWLVFA